MTITGGKVQVEIIDLSVPIETPPDTRPKATTLDDEIAAFVLAKLTEALDAEHWNQCRAARRLGITETRVRNFMQRFGLKPRTHRGRPRREN